MFPYRSQLKKRPSEPETSEFRDPRGLSGRARAGEVFHIAIDEIRPDPMQARRIFEMDRLLELAESIREFGVLSPLLVRRIDRGYQLIAGERRLRASALAGFTHVPCILSEADEEKAAYMSLVENLQRRDLDCFEEAAGLARLISAYGITQEEAARRVGKSQSAVANKLRLLRLDGECVAKIREAGLGERHARALLRLRSKAQVMDAIGHIADRRLGAGETDRYIDKLLAPVPAAPAFKTKALLRDFRPIINTIQNAVESAGRSGVLASIEQTEANGSVVLTIKLEKPAG